MEPDELILPTEPEAVDDPETDVEYDTMDEIPIEPPDPDDGEDDDDPDAVPAIPHAQPQPPAAAQPPTPAAAEAPAPAAAQAPAPVAPAASERESRPEAPLALYRRYRPDTFADVIGQEHVTAPLQRALENNRVNHAYLFSGPRGCGKTTSARILARCLNCVEGPTSKPCGVCASCRDLARGGAGSIDVIEIDAASHGGVDEARDLRERAFFAPVNSRYKIYIIDEAHMVTNAGFNALLKVVEEPPPHVKFIFATTEPEKVIGTIRSRTHHYPFRLVPPRTLSAYLGEVCATEGVRVEDAVLPLVVRAGAGSVRDSLSVLDQLLGGAGEQGVTYAQATALLGFTPDSLLDEIVDAFAAGDAEGVFAAIDRVMEVGQDPRRFAEDLLRRLRDLIIVAAVPDALASGLVDVAGDQAERLTTQAAGMGAGELTRAAEVIAQGLTDMRGTTAPRLHLELMCARVLLPGADVDARGIHARLDRVERRLNMAAGTSAQRVESAAVEPTSPQPSSAPPAERAASRAPSAEPEPTPPAPRPRTDAQPAPARPMTDAQPASARPTTNAQPAPARPAADAQPSRPAAEDPWADPSGPSAGSADGPAAQPAARADAPPVSGTPTGGDGEPNLVRAEAAASDPGTVSTADIRSMWPQVLDAVKNRRRVTWIVLRENAQVHAFADDVLTLSIDNPGARESLGRGGSMDIVREAVLEVLGIAPRIEAIAGDAEPPSSTLAQAAPPRPEQPTPRQAEAEQAQAEQARAEQDQAGRARAERAQREGAAQARQNITAMQPGPVAEDDGEETASRDDADLDAEPLGSEELLATQLGAELIAEETP
nr:DNA polymerase III subunit gamma and tau [Propioniciclava soli]